MLRDSTKFLYLSPHSPRAELMTVLSDLKNVYLRADYGTDPNATVTLSDVSMKVAEQAGPS